MSVVLDISNYSVFSYMRYLGNLKNTIVFMVDQITNRTFRICCAKRKYAIAAATFIFNWKSNTSV